MLSRRAALGLMPACAWAAAPPPNLVLFVSEGHAAADLSAEATPNLYRVAAAGLRFTLAFTPEAMGSPGKSSLLTGQYPLQHGAYEEFSFVRRDVGNTWLHWFQALGYRVTLAGEAGFGPRYAFPFEYQPLASVSRYLALRHTKPFCLVICLPALEEFSGETLDAAKPPPYAVDTPQTRRWMARYYHSLRGMDSSVADMLSRIPPNTITLYLSAHGPALPFARWSLYDAGIRIPLVVYWPGMVRAGQSEAMVSLVDVLPTLLEACGGAAPEGMAGRSFLNVLRGRATSHRDAIFALHHNRGSVSGSDSPSRAIRTARHKYILNLKHWNQVGNIWWRGNDGTDSRHPVRTPPAELWREWLVRSAEDGHAQNRTGLWRKRPPEELYDLQADPHELTNLHVEDLPEKPLLRAKLIGWMTEQKDKWLSFAQ